MPSTIESIYTMPDDDNVCKGMRKFDYKRIYFIVQNIRSLRKNFDRFVLEIQFLPALPHLLILIEIWAYSEN